MKCYVVEVYLKIHLKEKRWNKYKRRIDRKTTTEEEEEMEKKSFKCEIQAKKPIKSYTAIKWQRWCMCWCV